MCWIKKNEALEIEAVMPMCNQFGSYFISRCSPLLCFNGRYDVLVNSGLILMLDVCLGAFGCTWSHPVALPGSSMKMPIFVHIVMTSASDCIPNIRKRVDLVLRPSLFFRCTVDGMEMHSHDTEFQKSRTVCQQRTRT